jgi:hypothetical protein
MSCGQNGTLINNPIQVMSPPARGPERPVCYHVWARAGFGLDGCESSHQETPIMSGPDLISRLKSHKQTIVLGAQHGGPLDQFTPPSMILLMESQALTEGLAQQFSHGETSVGF